MAINEYRVASLEELEEMGYHFTDELDGKVLVGPDGFECLLGEPEDCNWYRDGRAVVAELNRLLAMGGNKT